MGRAWEQAVVVCVGTRSATVPDPALPTLLASARGRAQEPSAAGVVPASHFGWYRMTSIRLTYFNSPGRAESIRLALRIGGVAFEDHRIGFAEFGKAKAGGEFPLGSVPVLEVDGLKITQTTAMLRYAARLGEGTLYPADAFDGLLVDSVLETVNDTLTNALVPSLFERDTEKKLAMRHAYLEGPMTRGWNYLESLVARSGGPFLLGADLTVADILLGLHVGQVLSGGLDGIAASEVDAWPHLKALAEAFQAHPAVVAARG